MRHMIVLFFGNLQAPVVLVPDEQRTWNSCSVPSIPFLRVSPETTAGEWGT